MANGLPTPHWCATDFYSVFGEARSPAILPESGPAKARELSHAYRIKKRLTRSNPIEIIVENQFPIGLTTMKFLLFIAFAAGLLVLERAIIFSETFTEGVRVSPETATLKPG